MERVPVMRVCHFPTVPPDEWWFYDERLDVVHKIINLESNMPCKKKRRKRGGKKKK